MSIQENVSHLESLLAEAKAMLDKATEFDADYFPIVYGCLVTDLLAEGKQIGDYERVKIVHRGNGKWAICHGHSCLTKGGLWEYESMPSSRTDEFLAETRFASSKEAFAFYEQWKAAEIQRFKDGVSEYGPRKKEPAH
jgi:hypothetical protein